MPANLYRNVMTGSRRPRMVFRQRVRLRTKASFIIAGVPFVLLTLCLVVPFSIYNPTPTFAQSNETFSSGSFIINMGVTPQTNANGLVPYGMIYDLITNYNVEIHWVISTSKAKDGADFTYSGTDYKGGPFLIRAEDITTAVGTRITYWQGQGVQGVYTTGSITVPVYAALSYFPKTMIDNSSGKQNIISAYYSDAAIPSSGYTIGNPSQLGSCNDMWANPHGDPTWSTHSYLYNFVTVTKSYIWSQCHAVSMLEGVTNTSAPFQQLNYLTTNGLKCYSGSNCGSSITETHAGNPTAPYSHNFPSDPIMQFMSTMNGATTSGSENWYIPQSTGGWRSTTKRLVTSSDGASPNEGTLLVYGPAYGNSSNGYVMYEGGHDLDGSGTTADKVAAKRAYFNYVLLAGLAKQPSVLSSTIPSSLTCSEAGTVSVTLNGGSPSYTYAWSSTIGGTFANASAASTTYTAPSSGSPTIGVIKCVGTDACGRTKIVSALVTVCSSGALPVSLIDFTAKQNSNTVQLNWSTASESNNNYFTLAKSTDNKNFTELAKINGAGTTSLQHSYSFTDDNPFSGDIYYILSQTDYDGTTKSYPAIHITVNLKEEPAQGVTVKGAAPVPFNNYLRVNYSVSNSRSVEFTLMNSSGQRIRTENIQASDGENFYVFRELAHLPKGIYFIVVKDNGETMRVLNALKE